MTTGDLKKQLSGFNDDSELIFGTGDLIFYRTKLQGDKVQIEFNEIYDVIETEGEVKILPMNL
jgi:hypothetical protein